MNEFHPDKEPENGDRKSFLRNMLEAALIVILVVLPIRAFIAQPFIVSGASMQPTFESGDYLIVDQISPRIEELKRQEIIIFQYPKDPSKFFIKRIIGMPGETVELRGTDVYIHNDEHPEGFKLDEPYVTKHTSNNMEITLENDEYFVMGDNRKSSSDSRIWGPLPRDNIIGRALTRLFPPSHIELYPGSIQATP